MASGPDVLRNRKAALQRQAADEPESRVATARARTVHHNPFEQMRQMTHELGSSIDIMRKLLGKDWAGGKPSPPLHSDKSTDRVITTRLGRGRVAAGVTPQGLESPYSGLARGRQGRQDGLMRDRPTREAFATLLAPEASESSSGVERLVTVRGAVPHTELRKEPVPAQRAELPTAARVQQVMNADLLARGTSPTAAKLAGLVKEGKREAVASMPASQTVARIKAELGPTADRALKAPNVQRLAAARDSHRDAIQSLLTGAARSGRLRLDGMPSPGPGRQPGPGIETALEQPGAEATSALRGNDETHLETAKAELMERSAPSGRASLREHTVATARAQPKETPVEAPETELAPNRVTASAAALAKPEQRRRDDGPGKMTITIRNQNGRQLLTGDAEMS